MVNRNDTRLAFPSRSLIWSLPSFSPEDMRQRALLSVPSCLRPQGFVAGAVTCRKLASAAFVPVTGIFLASCFSGDEGGTGQPGDPRLLGPPEAAFPGDFASLNSVRELPNGTVLAADPFGQALYLVDLDAGERTVVGGTGSGPGEYQQPFATWPLPGDSTLLVDLGNARLVRIGPDLGFGESHSLVLGDIAAGSMVILRPEAMDGAGNPYVTGSIAGLNDMQGVAFVRRVNLVTGESDSLVTYKVQEPTITESGDGNSRVVTITQMPYPTVDTWGVAADGSIVIARGVEYSVEWIGPDGSRTVGEVVPFDPVPIGTSEKEEWVRASSRQGGMGMSVFNQDGVVRTSISFSASDSDPDINSYVWPEFKPPFFGGTIPVDPLGRAWVRRHVEAGAPSVYDLFDRGANRIASFEFDEASQVIGFGREHLYIMWFDEFDLAYLGRYLLPTT